MPGMYSEGKDSSVLAISERVYERLAHEESNCNAYSHSNHCTSNVNTIAVGGNPTRI